MDSQTEAKIEVIEQKNKCSDPHCPHCGSKNIYGMSRVVGYMSIIDNWNRSKQAELKRRQDGNYWVE
jgi:anaerobic ribonucleoside-triphosphate reductase